jgi:hypothetical protein
MHHDCHPKSASNNSKIKPLEDNTEISFLFYEPINRKDENRMSKLRLGKTAKTFWTNYFEMFCNRT